MPLDPSSITIQSSVTANVHFDSSNASFQNAIGMYTYDNNGNVTSTQLLFGNESAAGVLGAPAGPAVTLKAGDHVGFFLAPNAASQNEYIPANVAFSLVNTTDGQTANVNSGVPMKLVYQSANGNWQDVYTQYFTSVFTTSAKDNQDGLQHAKVTIDPATGQMHVAFEDTLNNGDQSFGNGSFTLDIGAANAKALAGIVATPPGKGDKDHAADAADKLADAAEAAAKAAAKAAEKAADDKHAADKAAAKAAEKVIDDQHAAAKAAAKAADAAADAKAAAVKAADKAADVQEHLAKVAAVAERHAEHRAEIAAHQAVKAEIRAEHRAAHEAKEAADRIADKQEAAAKAAHAREEAAEHNTVSVIADGRKASDKVVVSLTGVASDDKVSVWSTSADGHHKHHSDAKVLAKFTEDNGDKVRITEQVSKHGEKITISTHEGDKYSKVSFVIDADDANDKFVVNVRDNGHNDTVTIKTDANGKVAGYSVARADGKHDGGHDGGKDDHNGNHGRDDHANGGHHCGNDDTIDFSKFAGKTAPGASGAGSHEDHDHDFRHTTPVQHIEPGAQAHGTPSLHLDLWHDLAQHAATQDQFHAGHMLT